MSAIQNATGDLWPYLAIIVFGFLPSEIWRILGVVFATGLREDSQILVWVRAVATTLLAGVVAKLLLSPNGALAIVPFAARVGSIGIGLAAFFGLRRSVIAGVVAGEVALVTMAYVSGM
jgi:hypothetical protein